MSADVPLNINKGRQQYCLVNALGNALSIHIDRNQVDDIIEILNKDSHNKHGIIKIGSLSTHCLNCCVQRLVPEYELIRYPKDLGAKRMLKYLRFNRSKVGIIYGWTSYQDSTRSDAPLKTLSHAIAFQKGLFINDYNYKTGLVHNVSSIVGGDKHCLSRHFERGRQHPYTFRFYCLEKICDRVQDDKVLRKRRNDVTVRPNKRPGKRERLEALKKHLTTCETKLNSTND